jgi:3-deoxy-D-manno-octulosonic-acid transferase
MQPLGALIWSAAATAASPGLRLMLQRRAERGKEIAERLPERRGVEFMPRPSGRLLWLHAASVGEAVSALPLLSALPGDVFTVFTTGTVTSARVMDTRLKQLGLDQRVAHRFVPLDVPAWALRFLEHWRPDAACFLESELWPNILAACRKTGVPVALANARFSRRSAAAWSRAPGLARHVLGHFAWIAAQSEADAERLRLLGASDVQALGNLKFSAPLLPADGQELARLQALAGDRPRWLAASTHPADDAVVARVHRALLQRHPRLLTAVAPRHPERGADVAEAMRGAPRRALGQDFGPEDRAWVADTVGELGLLYRLFPNVFMGKSFAAGGGQNFLEPARLGCAVATGPQIDNFAEARVVAEAAGALTVVPDEEALVEWLDSRLRDPKPVVPLEAGGNLPSRLADRVVDLMGHAKASQTGYVAPALAARKAVAKPTEPAFWRHGTRSVVPLVLSPLSPVVAAGTARRVARRGWRAPIPVICCGNAVVGGAGKTTLALDLAHRLLARGLDVHLLTRGYRGRAEGLLRVDPAIHDVGLVGDEALLLAEVAPTWRSADRAEAAQSAIEAGAQILVMDDGLQNPTLAKTLSFLVIDGGFGFGNGRVLPAGPLRETVRSAASRSDAAVLIGEDQAAALADLPTHLPVLKARLQPAPDICHLVGEPVLAFAGIGRPEKFFSMLIAEGANVVETWPFPDHHPFAAAEIDSILKRARALGAKPVTTPKDFVRIPAARRPFFTRVGVSMVWESQPVLEAMFDRMLADPCPA